MKNGILNVLKPTGMSSHDIIGQIRRIYSMKKVGHAGTLDPLAAGVLPVYLGQATRLIEYGGNEIKTYHVEFLFGLATDTEDITGTVVAQGKIPNMDAPMLMTWLQERFVGDMEQRPSQYSAVNINGVKAYKLARQHQEFTLPSRRVTIFEIRLLQYHRGRGCIAVTCSKGTYMRSLVRDIGESLGTCAVMSYLVRVKAGLFDIDDAITLETLEKDPLRYILPSDMGIQHMTRINLPLEECQFLLQGRAVPFAGRNFEEGVPLRIYGPGEILVGIGCFNKEHHIIRPHKMFTGVL
ncbi:tRNA pseudouridine(55) synthase TruB [Megasphaera paucivorans]|uniref:tRNA pseudouridine synthase B n=1 Tax=Megasphaera paucivorans TaxID=349095 RepID=A0A1G9Q3D2_9FIRM|nr:tRNA pseudouridine(55) synthase TruB [Megasphaera paucivorans]SDM05552.1 tRNA pseudouridine55 synthase [Megasphaera paucivorans]